MNFSAGAFAKNSARVLCSFTKGFTRIQQREKGLQKWEMLVLGALLSLILLSPGNSTGSRIEDFVVVLSAFPWDRGSVSSVGEVSIPGDGKPQLCTETTQEGQAVPFETIPENQRIL